MILGNSHPMLLGILQPMLTGVIELLAPGRILLAACHLARGVEALHIHQAVDELGHREIIPVRLARLEASASSILRMKTASS